MAGHPEDTPLPQELVALLGADTVDHSGNGACRVVSGGGLVAKIGPAGVIAREAAVLRTALPVLVPTVVDVGPDWIVAVALDDDDGPWPDSELDAALADLAALHDAFEATVPDGLTQVLRRPFTADGADQLLEPVRRLHFALPSPLDWALDAAAVLWFLAYDLPHLTAGGGAPALLSRACAAAERLVRPAPVQARRWRTGHS